MNTGDRYRGRLFSILGDSLSTLDGYSIPSGAAFYSGMMRLQSGVLLPRDTWWGRVIDQLGGELLVNDSFSGSTVSRRPGCEIESYGCSDGRTSSLHREGVSPDVIFVLLGMNDWGCGARVTPESESDEGDLSVFSVAYTEMLLKLKKNYSSAEIWCFTFPVSRLGEDRDFPYLRGGIHIERYCDAVRACASECGCRLIELYRPSEPHDTVDGFHPNADGMRELADAVLSQIR